MSSSLLALLDKSSAYIAHDTNASDPTVVKPVVLVKTTVNKSSKPVVKGSAKVSNDKGASRAVLAQNADAGRDRDNSGAASLIGLLKPGTYDARSFSVAWRHAKNLNDQKIALSGYKGYDNSKSFSENEQHARFYAKRETAGIVAGQDRREVRSVQQTVQGYVAGMPRPQERLVMDLQARERSVLEMMSTHMKVAQDESKSHAERVASQAAIREGQTFLTAIRQELSAAGVEAETNVAPETAYTSSVHHED